MSRHPEQPANGAYARYGKRTFDLTLALLLLLPALPIFALTGLAVRFALGRPVLFRQQRPGLDGRPFFLLKFRSMNDSRDKHRQLLPDAERLTTFGRLLRRSSLDEIPGLWNVIRGEMSFVGPRPLLMRYLERYDQRQARRHTVRPGITGWAQVNGRNAVCWHEKLELDVWYSEQLSLALDLRILVRTVAIACAGHGVSAEGHATMPEFMGSEGTEGEQR